MIQQAATNPAPSWLTGALLSIGVIAVVLLTVGAIDTPLMDPDEARFAQTSLEMSESGDLVVPRFEGRPRVVKPPLLHWIQAFLFRHLGFSEWLARVPAIASTWLSLWIVAAIGWKRWGSLGAVWAPAIFITSPLVFVMGRIGTIDSLLSVHILAAVAVDLLLPRDHRHRSVLIGGLLGLAFLAKGPIGIGLPLLIVLAGRTATGRPLLPNITGFLKGMGSWGVIVLPWGVAFGNRLGWSEVAALLDTEVIQRYVEQESHARPFWFYGLVVAVGFLPWVVPLLHAVGRLIRYPRDPATSTTRYALAGLLMGTVLLSFSEGKLPSYFLPLAPLVAMIAAWQVGRQCARNQPGLPELALIIQGGVLATAAVLGGVRQDPGAIRQVLWTVAGSFAVMAIVGGVGYWRRQVWPIYTANAAAAAAILLAIGGLLHPELGARQSARDLVEQHPEIRETPNLRRVAMKLPSLTLYSGRIPEELELTDVAAHVDDAESPVGLWIFDQRDLESLDGATRRRFRTLGKSGKYVALATHPLPPPP